MQFSYIERESRVVGRILKPLIDIEFLSREGLWYGVDEVLVDTGADITLLPKHIGEVLVGDISTGRKASIKGITPFEVVVYIHPLTIRVAGKEFETNVAIADADEAPAVLGRFNALDHFEAMFSKGSFCRLD